MVLSAIKHGWYRIQHYYDWCLTLADDRVADWPLMSSPWPTLGLAAAYLTMVKLGPGLMANRKPLEFRWLLIMYNFVVMFLNLYIGVELAVVSYRLGYSWFCQPVDYSNNPDEIRIAAALWWYYISKLVEFCDTLFFILRKKNNQLTFLHIYHHSTMFSLWWIGVKFVAGGSSFLAAMVNSFVHVIMYAYYGLSAFGPQMQPYLWWKKHITCIQLVQFSSAGVLGIRALIVGCDFPLWMQYALVVYMLSFIILFGNFYFESYRRKGTCAGNKIAKYRHMAGSKASNVANGFSGINKSHVEQNSARNVAFLPDKTSRQFGESGGKARRRKGSENGAQTRTQTRRDAGTLKVV